MNTSGEPDEKAAAVVPNEWVLVPREPTSDMIGAGSVEFLDRKYQASHNAVPAIYKAMLSAAPASPAAGGGVAYAKEDMPRPDLNMTESGHDLKRSEVLSFDDGLLTVKMSGHGEANGWGQLAFREEQFELDADGFQVVEIPPSELRALRDFLNRVLASPHPTPDTGRAGVIEYWADWLVDAVAGATQNRAFLRKEPEEDKIATEAIYLNGKKAIENAICSLSPVDTGRAHRVMTPEEYAALSIKGWHGVLRDCDGCGNVGVRYEGTGNE